MISRHEREKLKVKLNEVDEEIKNTRSLQENCMAYIVAHAASFYDSVRLLTQGPATLGIGTREICCKFNFEGVSWANLLPRAKGEPAIGKKQQMDKLDRALKRKKAAAGMIIYI